MLDYKSITHLLSCFVIFASLSNPCLAETRFIDYFQTDPVIEQSIADHITGYYVENILIPIEQQKTELLKLHNDLENIKEKHKNQPTYWFLKGLNHRNLASYYFEKKNIKISDSHIREKDLAYAKAIELDKASTDNLSATIYSAMKSGLPRSLKIKAIQKEISLGGSGESESSYWYLHWSNIDQLKKSGRDDEAEQAYKNMLNEMKKDNTDMSVYDDLNKSIEKTTLQKPVKTKAKPTIKPAQKPETITKKEPYSPKDKKLIIISSIVVASLISLLALTFYERKIKKRKNKRHKD